MVDARHKKVRITLLVKVLQAEFDAGGRGGVQIVPGARCNLQDGLIGYLPSPKGHSHGHGALGRLGGNYGNIPELGHDLCQDMDSFGLVAVIVA